MGIYCTLSNSTKRESITGSWKQEYFCNAMYVMHVLGWSANDKITSGSTEQMCKFKYDDQQNALFIKDSYYHDYGYDSDGQLKVIEVKILYEHYSDSENEDQNDSDSGSEAEIDQNDEEWISYDFNKYAEIKSNYPLREILKYNAYLDMINPNNVIYDCNIHSSYEYIYCNAPLANQNYNYDLLPASHVPIWDANFCCEVCSYNFDIIVKNNIKDE